MKILVVGQGLAGTLAGHRLEKAGCTVHYLDDPGRTAASDVAAGIVNPITGRRFVKSWRIDELLPEVAATYGELETRLGRKFWHPRPLLRTLYNRGDLNDWQVRSADPGYARYLDDAPDLGRLPEITVPVFAYAGVRHAGRVDVRGLVEHFRDVLVREGRFHSATYDYNRTAALLGEAASADLPGFFRPPYDRIVFCEGWHGRNNPHFSFLGHRGNKGQVLFVRTRAAPIERLFKHRVFLVPVEDGLYWVGGTSENHFADDGPTGEGRRYLADRLAEILTVPYEIVDHRSAVRPTVRDRRMMIGAHPSEPRLLVFNGLGTKGASLGPLGAVWLARLVTEGRPVPEEVDVARFL